MPHEYVELEKPVHARFIKLKNIHLPTKKLAINELRVFVNGYGIKLKDVENFIVLRTQKYKQSTYLKMETGKQCLCL